MTQNRDPLSPISSYPRPDVNGRLSLVVLFITALASFLVPFMSSAINVALPAINLDYRVSATDLNWTVTAYILGTAAFILPAGRLGDLRGHKKVFLWGLTAYGLFSLLCPLSNSFPLLIAFRALQGAGGALISASAIAMLTVATPLRKRGRAIGLVGATTYLGISLGPPLGGFLTQGLGWRSIFYLNAIVICVILAYTLWLLRGQDWRGETGRFDAIGAILYGVGILLLICGLSMAGQDLWNLLLVFGAVVTLTLFVRWENRCHDPLFSIVILRNRAFAYSNLAALASYAATFGHSVLISFYLQTVKGLPPQLAGLLMLVQPLVQAIFSPLAGRAADRVEPRILASIGMALSTLSLFYLIFLQAETPLTWVIVDTAVMGLGFALFSAPNTYAVMSSVEVQRYGLASSTLGAMRLIGQSLAMALLSLLFALWMGKAEISTAMIEPFLGAARVSYGIAAALSFLAVFASLARGSSHSPVTSGWDDNRGSHES